ncbi:MAG TPA: AHH domain-containing protein [Myxococcaceae bacterium]|nr:AHH domain-containing protein [Myxococcaceae bacterium]
MQKHHIATIANSKSPLRGGPWTLRFEELFAKAGMRLNSRENTVPIEGHQGPHPQRYHEIVYERLAQEIATPDTELNRLVTLGR